MFKLNLWIIIIIKQPWRPSQTLKSLYIHVSNTERKRKVCMYIFKKKCIHYLRLLFTIHLIWLLLTVLSMRTYTALTPSSQWKYTLTLPIPRDKLLPTLSGIFGCSLAFSHSAPLMPALPVLQPQTPGSIA